MIPRIIGNPDWTGIDYLHIGNEAIDLAVLNCSENPEYGCRHSDAALGLYNDNTNYQLGKIARPTSRNQGDLQLDSSTPRFDITQEVGILPIAGDVLEKVGARTGWTGGVVEDECVNVAPLDAFENVSGPTRWCEIEVHATVGERDSGSPVFEILAGNDVELVGMLWGGADCSEGADGIVRCERFYASDLASIEQEAGGGAELQFVPSSGGDGGDGDDPGGPPCPPNCLESVDP